MPIELKMPALSPTMEEGTLAKWLVKVGDTVKSGDIMAEIETDKATMEFEAVDEGTISEIRVAQGSDGVKVGTVIALLTGEGEDAKAEKAPPPKEAAPAKEAIAPDGATREAAPASAKETRDTAEKGYGASPKDDAPVAKTEAEAKSSDGPLSLPERAPNSGDARVNASPLARRIAAEKGVELGILKGSGPNGRIVKADVEGHQPAQGAPVEAAPAQPASPAGVEGQPASAPAASPPTPAPVPPPAPFTTDIPHEAVKLSNVRKTIARRLTESKQTVPHIYLTVDVRLDALLALRGDLNKALEARGVKLSVNDMLIKALALALIEVPACNVSYQGNELIKFTRADISVAVSVPSGLITPIIVGADTRSMSSISTDMKALADKAKAGKLQPSEYQGGTASISNMGMMGIKQFDAVINPPQGMIMAVGAGEARPYVVDDALAVATVMSATGSFDHRAIDGSDGAALMKAFKALVESPLALVA